MMLNGGASYDRLIQTNTSCCTFLTEFVMKLGDTNGSMMMMMILLTMVSARPERMQL